MSAPRTANCIFCDDVRQEIGNKISLMGIYQSDIVISGKPPQSLPKLVTSIWLSSDIDDPVQEFTIRILAPANETMSAEIKTATHQQLGPGGGATRRILFITIPLSPFPLNEEGYIEVMIETDTGTIRAGRLLVKFTGETLPPDDSAN